MKKKICEITNSKMNQICSENNKNCKNCPLHRNNRLWCWKKIRAWYYANLEWYKNNYKVNPEYETLEEKLDDLKKEEWETEQEEIEL